METAPPEPEAQVYIHDKYMSEFVHATFIAETRDGLLAIVQQGTQTVPGRTTVAV